MKVSQYFKQKGIPVYLNVPQGEYDEVWLSCIFTWNRENAMSAMQFQKALGKTVHYGGTGFDWGWTSNRIELPPEIEAQMPDYDLYPGEDRAVGFAQRGCDRKC